MFTALYIALRKYKCTRRNEQGCNLEGRRLLCEERLENIVFGEKNCWKESTAWWSEEESRITEDAKFVICYSGVGEVVMFMWAVRCCILQAFVVRCSIVRAFVVRCCIVRAFVVRCIVQAFVVRYCIVRAYICSVFAVQHWNIFTCIAYFKCRHYAASPIQIPTSGSNIISA